MMNLKVVPGDAAVDDPDRLAVANSRDQSFLIGHGQVLQFDNDIRAYNIGAVNLAVGREILFARVRPRILLSSE